MKQPNKDYIIQSLQGQISNSSFLIAERDAIITEQHQEIQELKKQIEEITEKQIEEMDSAE
ncbi:hypothetical protein [Virgibacillus salexigens]|uniref:Uncharacterized protein n=1 Tax=Virgibacillus kapii TaxID=1638645 RepID=A0ABQ2D751_9BACI|nr:hypothetical protein [Virgibacillus kapii]GGJ48428.1 hypothetical protein GCM10007111_08140 [Virgibacillus kapii]